MKRYRKLIKKRRVLALFLALILMMAPAFSSYAEGSGENTPADREVSEEAVQEIADDSEVALAPNGSGKKLEITAAPVDEEVQDEKPETLNKKEETKETEVEKSLKTQEGQKTDDARGAEEKASDSDSEASSGGDEEQIITVLVTFTALDENGQYRLISRHTSKENAKDSYTLQELGITFPEVKAGYQGLKFVGWVDREGREITEDTQIVDPYYLEAYAKYDKGVATVNYRYPNNQGEWSNISQTYSFDHGETYGEFIKSIEGYVPEDILKEAKFVGWEYSRYNDDGSDVLLNGGYINADAKFDKGVATVNYSYPDDQGGWSSASQTHIFDYGETYGQFVKSIEGYVPEDIMKEVKFLGWEYDHSLHNDSDELSDWEYISVDAKFDKGVAMVRYNYPNDQGGWSQVSLTRTFEYGQTYGQFIENMQYVPEDIAEEAKLTGWEYDYSHDISEVISVGKYEEIPITAKFEGAVFAEIEYYYYDKGGRDRQIETGALKVDEGKKAADVIEILNKAEAPESYPGLRFKQWDATVYREEDAADTVKDRQRFVAKAIYENCIVRYIINAMLPGGMWPADTIFCQVAEKGETVTLPASFEDSGGYFTDIHWGYTWGVNGMRPVGSKPDETFAVNEDMTFHAAGWYTANPDEPANPDDPSNTDDPSKPSDPSNPDDPSKPSDPSKPDDPAKPSDPSKPDDPAKPSKPTQDSTTNQRPGSSSGDSTSGGSTSNGSTSGDGQNPGVTQDSKLPDTVVNSVIEAVNAAEPGQNIRVNMNGRTAISKEILEAARGKDVNLTLQMDGYSWTINGRTIQSVELKDIDLRVIKNTQNIPSATVRDLAGNNPCMQLTLAHEGSFGFQATLTVGVGAEYAGKYGNLYYHDSAGKMVFINAGQIDANGNVSLIFSHASDYLLVMSEKMMSQADVPSQLMPSDVSLSQNGSASASGVSNNTEKSVKTGDSDMAFPWILLCIAAAGTMVYMCRKKQA